MTDTQRNLALRLIREQSVTLSMKNETIRKNFGDRLTKALTAECNQRDLEIEALNLAIDMLEQAKPGASGSK